MTNVDTVENYLSRLGVNTHIIWENWGNWRSETYADREGLAHALQYLGINLIRESASTAERDPSYLEYLAAEGVRFNFLTHRTDVSCLPETISYISRIEELFPGSVHSVEGPNEVWAWPLAYEGCTGALAAIEFQADLYRIVHSDEFLSEKIVYNFTDLHNAGISDYANFHTYSRNGGQPTNIINLGIDRYSRNDPGKPIVITETGWSVGDRLPAYSSLTGQPLVWATVTEEVQARHVLNAYASVMTTGLEELYIYDLVNPFADRVGEKISWSFGLFNSDWTPKQSAYAVHNFTQILRQDVDLGFSEPSATAEILTSSSSLKHFLLQKSEELYSLVVWDEFDLWDEDNASQIDTCRNAIIDLGKVYQEIVIYDPMISSAPQIRFSNLRLLDLSFEGSPLIVSFRSPNEYLTRVIGGLGSDSLIGTSRCELISSFDGSDTILSGLGNDTVMPGSGADSVHSGPGNDSVIGYIGDDTIYGGIGTNTLNGGSGNDILCGGNDDDCLLGEWGNDSIHGRAGDDTIVGGAGSDDIIGSGGEDSIIGNGGSDKIRGCTGNDTIDGGAANDLLYGHVGTDRMLGGIGNDSLFGGDGADTLLGNNGDDRISGGYDNDSMRGGDDCDFLTGGVGDDLIFGGNNNDTVFGGAGNDVMYGEYGNDVLSGNEGADTISAGFGDDTISGGPGEDKLHGGSGHNLIFGGIDCDNIIGGAGDDTICGNSGGDAVFGSSGNDSIKGGAGRDFLDGGVDNDLLRGDTGADSIIGQNGSDTIFGGSNWDTIRGGQGDDLLIGEFGNDFIGGGAGCDTLYGGVGSDSMHGGSEIDIFRWERLNEIGDVIPDFVTNIDRLEFFGVEFGGLPTGELREFNFSANMTGEAVGFEAQFIYNITEGQLSFDPDGCGVEVRMFVALIRASQPVNIHDIVII